VVGNGGLRARVAGKALEPPSPNSYCEPVARSIDSISSSTVVRARRKEHRPSSPNESAGQDQGRQHRADHSRVDFGSWRSAGRWYRRSAGTGKRRKPMLCRWR